VPARRALQNRRLIGRRVAQVRRERGWTQEELAERLGVSVRYLQAVEAGQENLTLDSLTQLALRLDLSLGELVDQALAATTRRLPTRTSSSEDDVTFSRAADELHANDKPASKAKRSPKRRSRPVKTSKE
jgi:transcriptional regulator with XRE-family HTH domain